MNKPTYPDHDGSPFDRGMADSYYGSAKKPHYWIIEKSPWKVTKVYDLTDDEIEAYNAGYDYNESIDNHKDYER